MKYGNHYVNLYLRNTSLFFCKEMKTKDNEITDSRSDSI